MKKILIIITIIFAAITVSCNSDKSMSNNSPVKKNEDEVNQAEQSTDVTVDEASPELPEIDFNGEKINFFVRGGEGNEWDAIDIYAESETGESVNDAIYRRNRQIESKFNTLIAEASVAVGDGYNALNKLVKAGDTSYHAVIANAQQSFSMTSNSLLLDLHEVPYINLGNSWWDTALNKDMSLLNKQYYAASATNLMAYDATWIAMFSKKVLTDRGYDPANIYNMVREGKWTLEKYRELTKDFISDLDGDEKMTDKDRYGTAGQGTMSEGFYICGGLRFIEKDEDDKPVFKGLDERGANILELVSEICNNKTAFQSHNTTMNKSGYEEYGRTLLVEGRTLFFTEAMICVRVLRDMTDDFGVVPMPKYDEAQEKYTSLVHEWAVSLTSVPVTCPNTEMAGIILEEMAYQSQKTVLPVYFDIAINGKYLRDDDSIEMIDYIMNNRVMDLCVVNSYGSLNSNISDAVYKGGGNFVSIYEKAENNVIKQLEKLMENILK